MQALLNQIISDADARIPNSVPFSQKLRWLYELECRIAWEIRPQYDAYTFTVDEDTWQDLPFSGEQIEWVSYNGKVIPKLDLRSGEAIPCGTYQVVYRLLPDAFDEESNLLLSKNHPYFGVYEEYLCMQLAKYLCDTARYSLAEEHFKLLWEGLGFAEKRTSPQNPLAKVRGL